MKSERGKPHLLVRYSNRKLYSKKYGQYVSLQDLLILIQEGQVPQIYDYDSGDNVTHVMLGELIATEAKKQLSGEKGFPELSKRLLEIVRMFFGISKPSLISSQEKCDASVPGREIEK